MLHHTLFFQKVRSSVVAFILVILAFAGNVVANDAAIVEVAIRAAGADNSFRIDVTLAHDDTGWDHYANRWDVLDEQGNLLGSRTLHHPHVNEQPFTRSLTLEIPAGIKVVTIVASGSVHGDNSETKSVNVPGR